MDSDNANLLEKCHFLVKWIGVVIVLISVSVVIGTIYQIITLTNISPSWVNMKINTAICFFLAGLALLLLNIQNRTVFINTLIAVFSACILLISGLTIIEYTAGLNFGIDELLIKERLPLSPGTISPGRMALITAISFMLSALAFLWLLRKMKSAWMSQTLAWLIELTAILAFFNYLYGADITYVFAKYTTMAMHTAFLAVLMGIGILLLKPDSGIIGIILKKNTTGYLLRRIIVIPIILPIFLIYVAVIFQKKGLIDQFGVFVIVQAMIFILTGIMILITSLILDHKEKKLSEAQIQIQHNEMIFRQFVENIDIVFYTASPDFRKILYVSPAYEKIWGRSVESLYQNPKEWYEAILPEDQPIAYDAFFVDLQKGNGVTSAEYRIKRPDGSIRYVFARAYRLKDEKNNIFSNIGIAVDMTNIKIEKIYKQLQYDIMRLIENTKNIEAFSPKLLQLICHSLDFDLGELWLIDESKNSLRCVDIWHKESDLLTWFDVKSRQHTFDVAEGFPGRIWKTKQPLWIANYSSNPVYARSAEAKTAGLNSAFGVPLIYHDKIFGIINFFSFSIRNPEPELLTMMDNIGKSIGELIERFQSEKKFQDIARHDLLTGLLNRSAIEEDLDTLIADKTTLSIAVIVFDIDRFKLINEAFGHEYGDILLKFVSQKLVALNKNKNAELSRLGADKFIFYFPETDRKDAYDFCNTIHCEFKEPLDLGDNKINLSISMGIALYPQDGLDSKTLVMNADLAVIEAKNQGDNKISFFTKELSFIASKTLSMVSELRDAMDNDQFFLAYQPQMDLKTNTMSAAEALVRWQHPTRGLIYPAKFIPFAEKNNLIVPLNEHVMRMIFQQISLTASSVPISINISAQQFKNGFHLVDYLELLMKEFSVKAQDIELEITENMLMEDTEHNIAVLTALHELGFQIAIDDFGTGYSSFSYLNRLPTHKIKIDRTFIAGLPGNSANAKIVKAMITMVHSLDKIVVAEGAETQSEVDFLKQEKCDIIQGFYYYKPILFDEFAALVKKVKDGSS